MNELYESLVGPLVDALRGSELVIVPHAFMHYLPFHAFYDGRRYVVDDYAVSYAPSATVFVHCHELPAAEGNRSLILGIPDRTAPFILDEVHAVADAVSEPEVLLGSEASLKALREKAPGSRLMHIATHGYYRKDNPMFSAIRLGDSYLSLYDLYELSLPVDLVTVSACATGLSVVVEGDEILGLVRGLLFAGARSFSRDALERAGPGDGRLDGLVLFRICERRKIAPWHFAMLCSSSEKGLPSLSFGPPTCWWARSSRGKAKSLLGRCLWVPLYL